LRVSYEVTFEAANNFQSFVGAYDTRTRDQGGKDVGDISYEHLDGFIWRWLTEGDAVDATGGDYETYLLAIILITERWSQDPSCLDYRGGNLSGQSTAPYERRARSGFPEEGPVPRCLDRGHYNLMRFGKLTGAWPDRTLRYI